MPAKRSPSALIGGRAPDLVQRLYEMREQLGLAGAAVLVVVLGWWGYSTWTAMRESTAQARLTEALTALDKVVSASPDDKMPGATDDELRKALEHLTDLRREHPSSRAAEQALVQIGNLQYQRGGYQDALQAFQEYLERYPSGHSTLISALGKAYSLEALDRAQEAAAVFRNVVDRHQDSVLRADALLGLGRTLKESRDPAEAEKAYLRVIEEFPGSLWAVRAEELMASMGR
jgi:TolA-binding protein